MSQTVFCQKLKKELPALARQPWPGEIRERIQAGISEQAWKGWLDHAKMLINEYRLNLGTDEAQAFMKEQMLAYLFDEGQSMTAEGYVPEQDQ